MKKRSKVMIIILALIVLSALGGAVMSLKSGRPGGGDLSAYMERKYNKEFEIIEEFTYIAYTDGEPETQRKLKCPAVKLRDKENGKIICFAYAYPMETGDWIYRDNYSRKVFLYCLGEENLVINNEEKCGTDTSFSYPCLSLDNTFETAQKLQNAVILFHKLYPCEGYESFEAEGSIYLYRVWAENAGDCRTEETGAFGCDTPIEEYKTFLEGLEQARGEDDEISEQFSEDKLTTDIGIEEEINFEEEMIINFDDAFGRFEIPSDISRDVVVEEYSDNFPMELQEVLVHLYDDIDEENNADWKKYEADCEIITLETCGDISFEDIANAADVYSIIDKRSMRIADIDRDGIDEYVINDSIGRGDIGCIYVVKNVDGKWTLIGGGNARYSSDVCTILEYENKYYLLVGENLSYWNEEVEIPDEEYWKHWDSTPWQADCWDSLRLKKEIISYTPYETYSYLQDDSVDYLSDIDLISLENNSAEEESFGIQHWFVNGRTFRLEYGWEKEQAGKKYFYVVSTIDEVSKDMLMTVLCERGNEKMIVKVYYLVANYKVTLNYSR